MKVPLSWLKDFVEINIPIDELAYRMTLAGLEVEEIRFVGLPLPQKERIGTKITGFSWNPKEIVVGAIHEVMPHPNADRLVLTRLDDGEREHIVLTGAPNLFPYKGKGPLEKPLKVAYAREGATIIDAYTPGNKTTRLKRKKIRGVESYSMACSERELGISEEHEGIIILDEDAPVGVPLVDYMGDAVLDIAITPNVARNANILGVAREIAALTGAALRQPKLEVIAEGPPIEGKVSIQITDPKLNPRFVLGLIEGVENRPSPYKAQLRLKLAGMRPIDAVVDATNYAMLELGEPLHAFDYDILAKRAGGQAPTIITRPAQQGERLVTLDGVKRQLDDFTVLVCDQSGSLALAGVMGGAESEVRQLTLILGDPKPGDQVGVKGFHFEKSWIATEIKALTKEDRVEEYRLIGQLTRQLDDSWMVHDQATGQEVAVELIKEATKNVLLEGACWNMFNTRRTVLAQTLPSEAAYRFERGVHPELALKGVLRGLELMRQWAGGSIAKGVVDNYPLPADDPTVEITPADVQRWLGVELTPSEIADILESIDFQVELEGQTVKATTPPHRLDIGTGITGVADLMEEVARIYGYDRIPETRIADELPHQKGNLDLEIEERLRDLLVNLGLQEVITHRLTTPEREARRLPPQVPAEESPYFQLTNPVTSDRNVLRHSLLVSLLETIERNARIHERLAIFEIGPIYLASEEGELPDEPAILGIAVTGPRALPAWQPADDAPMDFYDLKGILDTTLRGLYLKDIRYEPVEHPSFHPGKCARIFLGENPIGVMGELHPQVRERYDLPETPLLAAELNLAPIIDAVPGRYSVSAIPSQPPVLEDIALIVNESLPAAQVEDLIRQTGGRTLSEVRLFDVYRGEQIGKGKKSLAYSLTYQDPERTLTDKEVAKIRNRIVQRVEQELGAKLRG